VRTEHTFDTMPLVTALQGTLLGAEEPGIDGGCPVDRVDLGGGAWVDLGRGWLRGAETLLDVLVAEVAWKQGRRFMYDRVVEDPRLSKWYQSDAQMPHAVFAEIRAALSARYPAEFGGFGLNYYRDGRDSVAFHADRELRYLDDTLIAIVTLGAARPFLLRRRGGGPSRDLRPGSGDLLVMGGRCQVGWEHCVPKVASAGPRISATLRWSSERGPLTYR
jgi:alkylated DNA repair dioxygenase AlkB